MVASYEREDVALPSTLNVVAHKVGAAPHPTLASSTIVVGTRPSWSLSWEPANPTHQMYGPHRK